MYSVCAHTRAYARTDKAARANPARAALHIYCTNQPAKYIKSPHKGANYGKPCYHADYKAERTHAEAYDNLEPYIVDTLYYQHVSHSERAAYTAPDGSANDGKDRAQRDRIAPDHDERKGDDGEDDFVPLYTGQNGYQPAFDIELYARQIVAFDDEKFFAALLPLAVGKGIF